MNWLNKIAIAQIDVTVGDINGNMAKLLAAHKEATALGAELLITPELSLIGYPPEDLVLMPEFRTRAQAAAEALAAQAKGGAALLIGGLWEEDGEVYNAALLMDDGEILHIQPKTSLPNYGVFDEKRVFDGGSGPVVAQWRGRKLGLLVCEDMWHAELAADVSEQGAEILIAINASPYELGKMAQRHEVAAAAVLQAQLPLVYVNMVGGQDDIVFDGGSFAMDEHGKVISQFPEFAATVALADTGTAHLMDDHETLWNAMALGLRSYVDKNGFPGVVLGLSGGIDSAISAALAVDALGPSRVRGVLMSSPYTSRESVEDAQESARLLGIETYSIPISPGMAVMEEVLSPALRASGWMEEPAVGGNLQARLRGVTLMAISNKTGFMVLSTGNKSEISVGYSTLYGDSCGGYNVLKDLYKTQVYAVAHWRNGRAQVIPPRSISKAPSAELKPGQLDQDQLPPYDVLDAILQLHIEHAQGVDQIVAQGFARETVEKILRMVKFAEYKRRQSCPGVKLSPMMFGRDRRYPLTNKF